MSVSPEEMNKNPARTFRRFKDGKTEWRSWQDKIFEADASHKCPEYVLSTPPCQGSCPAGEDIRGYLNIVRGVEKPVGGVSMEEYAWRRLTSANPFPSVMGRVCPAPCESGCNRNEVDDFVGINSVEHYLGEYAITNNLKFAVPEGVQKSGKKVAIIGGGPAGLSVAYQLTLKGHSCTIFDEHELLGGMMRYGIPGFRTPRAVLDTEIQRIIDLGVEVKLNVHIGKDITLDQIKKDYDAIFMGMGAQAGRPLPVPGADAPNVVTAMAFLRAFNDGRLQHVGKRVVVIGGGDTSIDVATVARRLGHIKTANPSERAEHIIAGQVAHDVAAVSAKDGAEVVLCSRSPVDQMNANKHEVDEALAEGIEIKGSITPVSIVVGADGRATALRVAELETVGGKQVVKEGTEYDIPADLIVSAIGQAVDFTGLDGFDNGKGLISADKHYQVPGQKGIFVGGDVLRPHLLTTAIGHGRIAAESIDHYLSGEDLGKRPKVDVAYFDVLRKEIEVGLAPEKYQSRSKEEVKKAEGFAKDIDLGVRGTDKDKFAVHNFEDRSEKYVIPSTELFLGHFPYTPRNKRSFVTLTAEQVLGHFEERLEALDSKTVVSEAKRCMSCGLCFECDNCVIYCPQTAVFKVKKAQSTTGRYVDTDYSRCIGCHICADVCPTGYIKMGMGD
ncbi:glutamate synthase (NADPH) small subunit [Sulfuricella denitrificans skB26]|uniref:Glutamate synthase (NADPH) small subunit n=1 Tax=Sulfuricella denitrificans (strain DSM 22764 / NBRC 105220 / skB26) TaxID=1163617 RepID=S6AB41_SULDS|nr:NAD(P)-binding protein [Sulfuricella denitrificans]BAN36510.1 glutamate synthase (NADPH) small subunit [Sulfuricella denitrificans skB26]